MEEIDSKVSKKRSLHTEPLDSSKWILDLSSAFWVIQQNFFITSVFPSVTCFLFLYLSHLSDLHLTIDPPFRPEGILAQLGGDHTHLIVHDG